MASKHQMTGMLGVYLVAAELSKHGFIVSPTSRSAAGADLLVTDQKCQKAWSVQVKTNNKPANFWLVGAKAKEIASDSHMYVFVNVGKGDRAESSWFRVPTWPQRLSMKRARPALSGTHLLGPPAWFLAKDGSFLAIPMEAPQPTELARTDL